MKTVIPAQPGLGACIPLHDEKGRVEDIIIEPVIAWFVDYHGDDMRDAAYALPITAMDGLLDCNILQRPDGSFGEPDGPYFDDKEAVLQELERQLVRDEELRKRRLEREQADRNKQAPPPIPMRNFKATI